MELNLESIIEVSKFLGGNGAILLFIRHFFKSHEKKINESIEEMKKEKEAYKKDSKENKKYFDMSLKDLSKKIDYSNDLNTEKFNRINERISDQNSLIIKEMSAISHIKTILTKELLSIKENHLEIRSVLGEYRREVASKWGKIESIEKSQNDTNKTVNEINRWINKNMLN